MVYLILANGFEEIEALTPVDVLRRGGVNVKTVAVTDKRVVGAHGIEVTADMTIDEVDEKDTDMIILPGGTEGTANLDRCSKVHSLLTYAYNNDKFIAAICAAPRILGYDGILCGRRATCYPDMEKYLIGAKKTGEHVVRDGNVITSDGMGSSLLFALAVLEVLTDGETAQKVAKSVMA